jgi:DNA-binding MarR family transcriptional regulator
VDRLTSDELSAWRAFIEGSLRVHTCIDEDLKAFSGMTLFDYHILVLLSEAPDGRLRMRDLAQRIAFAPSRLTYQATRMEQKGWIEREACEDDARGTYAAITPAGRQALRRATPAHVRSIRAGFLDTLDERDIDDLARIFSRLRARSDVQT